MTPYSRLNEHEFIMPRLHWKFEWVDELNSRCSIVSLTWMRLCFRLIVFSTLISLNTPSILLILFPSSVICSSRFRIGSKISVETCKTDDRTRQQSLRIAAILSHPWGIRRNSLYTPWAWNFFFFFSHFTTSPAATKTVRCLSLLRVYRSDQLTKEPLFSAGWATASSNNFFIVLSYVTTAQKRLWNNRRNIFLHQSLDFHLILFICITLYRYRDW